VYLRTSLTGDEPPDVLQYADAHAEFPHHSTLDQLFSENQFESYRALGYHVAQEVFGESALPLARGGLDPAGVQRETRRLFARVRRRWFPPPPEARAQFVATAQKAIDLEQVLRTDPRLQDFSRALYPEWAARPGADVAELHAVNDMLQVMEMAWFAMDLD